MPGLGHVKLSDLASIVGPRKQPVMRDRYFQPVRRLSDTCGWPKKRLDHRLTNPQQQQRILTISVLPKTCAV